MKSIENLLALSLFPERLMHVMGDGRDRVGLLTPMKAGIHLANLSDYQKETLLTEYGSFVTCIPHKV